MKAGNIFLIIITSIITFIGLCFNKLYTKFVKDNPIIQFAIYSVFTLSILRVLYWVSKPFLKGLYTYIPKVFSNVHITFTLEPSISMTVVAIIFIMIMIGVLKNEVSKIK